jgi:hypothetical protein
MQSFLLKAQGNYYSEPPYFRQPPDTINFDFKNFAEKDTLKLAGEIRDSGEFGGHLEYITIYGEKAALIAKLFREPPCDRDKQLHISRLPDSLDQQAQNYLETIRLNIDEEKLICDYIQEFSKFAAETNHTSNAPALYTVSINKKKYMRTDPTTLPKYMWYGFINLRDKLFLK